MCPPHPLLEEHNFSLSHPVVWLPMVGVHWLQGSRAHLTFLYLLLFCFFLLDSAFCQEECRNSEVSRRKWMFAKHPALVKRRHVLLFRPRPCSLHSCRSRVALWDRDEPSSFSSPVVAASLQGLSPGTNVGINLAGSSLKPDADLLRIPFFPTCSFCHVGGSSKLSVSIRNTICCLLTNISPQHVKLIGLLRKVAVTVFTLVSKCRALADLPPG